MQKMDSLEPDSKPLNAWKRAAMYTKTMNAFMDNVSIAASEAPSEYDARKVIKYGNTYQAAWGIFSEYCNNSTIHGIRYLGEQKRPCLERLFWIFIFVMSIYACSKLTMNIYEKWENNPVIVSFAEKSTPVWQIPFPSVTVCPETKSRQELFNFTRTYWKIFDAFSIQNLTAEELMSMEAVSQVCDKHLTTDFPFENGTSNASAIIQTLVNLAPVFNDTYIACKWRNKMEECDLHFHKVITEEGLCQSFNSLDPTELYREEAIHNDYIFELDNNRTITSHWNLEDGYASDAGPETFPERVLGAGARAGLFLVVSGYEKDSDYLCRGPVQGFKILLHTPGEMPQVSKQYLRIPFGQEVLISIKPNIITTSEGLKYYKPIIRQCYFQKERYLRYFKVYTQNNCELECIANYTLKKCGCVQFSMPRNADTPVCGAASIACFNHAEDKLLVNEFEQGLKTSAVNFRGETDCNCLPACTSITYDAEISQADYNYYEQFKSFRQTGHLNTHPGLKLARLSIFFKEAQFLTSKRSELYGTTDFLANCGGLLGLFMGVSTLSLVELLYFCTVRLITNLKMRQKKKKQLKYLSEIGAANGGAPEIVVSNENDKKK